MYFQISPVIHKKPKHVIPPSENEEATVEVLSLAPFTPNPKIAFENILIGSVQSRKLLIKNPTAQDVNLLIKKSMPDEINLVLSWTEATVPRCSEVILEMAWNPKSEEACRYTFTVTDGKRISRDVAVIFKSVAPKKIKVPGKCKPKAKSKSPVKTSLRRKSISPVKRFKPTNRSPAHKTTKSLLKPCFQSQYNNTPWSNLCTNSIHQNNPEVQAKDECCKNKENFEPLDLSTRNNSTFVNLKDSTFTSGQDATFALDYSKNNENARRETFILNPSQVSQDRRETFVFQLQKVSISETKTTFTMEQKINSLNLEDSLEETTSPLPLKELNRNITVNSVFNQRKLSPNFEDKLKRLSTFSLSPTISPYNIKKFIPTICSTTSKPSSTNNSYDDKPKNAHNKLFAEEQSFSQLNLSGETYTKENLSGGTYTKLNISQGTFVKDSSIGDLNQLDLSPLSTRSFQNLSPVFLKPKPYDFFDSTGSVSRHGLSAIAEESSLLKENSFRNGFKRKSPSIYRHSSPKRANVQTTPKKSDWSKQGALPYRTAKASTGLNLQKFVIKPDGLKSTQAMSSITETKTKTVIVQNPFLFANILDPFMTSQIYCNEDWIGEQEKIFKKWLNALLTPPEELNSKVDGVDVAKIWQDCKKNEVKEAPTKETLSLNYHSNSKLDQLRKHAQNLFRSKEVSDVLQKVCLVVETGKLSIRDDKDIHLNLKLKSDLIALILGYNPLWLRIGLETIYNEVISLKSNSDITGLINFLMERFFKDPHLIKKHKSNIYAPKYAFELRKFILKKFFCLVYFLDKAKMSKLIQHDPCLFCKNAQEKESRLLLTHFARETLSAVGDINKYLRMLGYTVLYIQTYIHEFDYAVKNLGGDLRDGVRLARVMEIIQIRDDITTKLRVPAISRLQKVHNMQVVFQSLKDSGYEIQNEISAKDIVDGHKEKTLSFLWQIIYKFEAPLMVKSVSTIQTWFRSLPVMLKRRKLQKMYQEKQTAARKIQDWYNRQKQSRKYKQLGEILKQHVMENIREKAALKIQNYWRMVVNRRKYLQQYKAITKVQAFSKGWLIRNRYRERILSAIVIQKNYRKYIAHKQYLKLKNSAVVFQRRYRSLIKMRSQRKYYTELRVATVYIQQKFRANLQMRICKNNFLAFKFAAIKIQSIYRMHIARKSYLLLKKATCIIQIRYRAQKKMNQKRNKYLDLKTATTLIQRRYRAKKLMEHHRSMYLEKRSSSIIIQSFWRMYRARTEYLRKKMAVVVIQNTFKAVRSMKVEKDKYLKLRQAAILLQRRYREYILGKKLCQNFLILRKAAVFCQSNWKSNKVRKQFTQNKKAAVILQNRFRAIKNMQKEREYYTMLKNSTVLVQQRFRGNCLMKKQREIYLQMKQAAVVIQSRYRMCKARKAYLELKQAAVVIQQRYLALKFMQKQRAVYQELKCAVVIVQQRWKANQLYKTGHVYYQSLKFATISIQQRFRATKLMQIQRKNYRKLKSATLKIQSWYRSILQMRNCRTQYLTIKKSVMVVEEHYLALTHMRLARRQYQILIKSTVTVQLQYRALIKMRFQRKYYLSLKSATISIQQRWRAKKLMREKRTFYLQLRCATVNIQNRFRANRVMKLETKEYHKKKTASVTIQRWFRATIEMRKCRNHYQSLKVAVRMTKDYYKAKILMKTSRNNYTKLRSSTIVIQRRYRALLKMRDDRKAFVLLKKAATCIQRRFRANNLAEIHATAYYNLKIAAIAIQRRYRAQEGMKLARYNFITLKRSAIVLQQRYRAKKLMETNKLYYQKLLQAIFTTQSIYRAQKSMIKQRNNYQQLKKATVMIQQKFRANKLRNKVRSEYVQLKKSVITVETYYQAKKFMIEQKSYYENLKKATVCVQRQFRANYAMKEARQNYEQMKRAATVIQTRLRAYLAMKSHKAQYDSLKQATSVIQRRYRANKQRDVQKSEFIRLRQAAVCIQRRYRAKQMMIYNQTVYCRIKWAVLVIQHRYRAQKVMKSEMAKYLQLRHATFVIQRKWRARILMKHDRKQFLAFKKSITVIQSQFKVYLLTKRARELFLMKRMVVLALQRYARGYLVRKKYRPHLTPEAVEARKVARVQNVAATKIQAVWRGYSLRNSKIPQLVAMKKRNQKISEDPRAPSVPGRTLAQRCEMAIFCMTNKNSTLLQVIKALEDLDFITRHCQNSCISMSMILPDQLYIIISSAARSLPEMDACNLAAFILINFYKYSETRQNSWVPESIDSLINVLLHWCDKEAPLFSTLCTLLWLFAHEEKWKKVILALPNINQRLFKIHSLIQRKQSMVSKSNRLAGKPSYFGAIANTKLPTLTATWGLDYDRPNAFTNAVFAVESLLRMLFN